MTQPIHAYTKEQIADLFDLQPWQRELLDQMLQRDRIEKEARDSFRAEVIAEYERICKWLTEALPEELKAAGVKFTADIEV